MGRQEKLHLDRFWGGPDIFFIGNQPNLVHLNPSCFYLMLLPF